MSDKTWWPRIAAAGVPCYALAVYWLDRSDLSGPLVDAILMPAMLALFFSTILLKPFGLTTGGWFDMPTDIGCLLAIAVYAIAVWGVVRLLTLWR